MYAKVAAAVLTLVIVIVMTVSVSYAWITLSTSPAVSGAQVTIAGGTTIMLAPDITKKMEGGTTVHYPGVFSDNLVFSRYPDSYGYLSNLAGLVPVSTADGMNWIMPSYDEATGELKDYNDFIRDDTLSYANSAVPNPDGHYAYLDFWVVSPGSDYKLRVSSDVKTQRGASDSGSRDGCSLMALPKVVKEDGGFALEDVSELVASVARVGFLVNGDGAGTPDMYAYTQSESYDTRYLSIKGVYQEKGDPPAESARNKFTIYEPNGTLHDGMAAANGDYIVTTPLGYDPENGIAQHDIRSILTVQTSSLWAMNSDGSGRLLDELFQASIAGKIGLTVAAASDTFIRDVQMTRAIKPGMFFTRTEGIYENAASGVVTEQKLSGLDTSGATDDVFITVLERNTPQRIRMFIWLEGMDADCAAASAQVTSFVLNLELAGAK